VCTSPRPGITRARCASASNGHIYALCTLFDTCAGGASAILSKSWDARTLRALCPLYAGETNSDRNAVAGDMRVETTSGYVSRATPLRRCQRRSLPTLRKVPNLDPLRAKWTRYVDPESSVSERPSRHWWQCVGCSPASVRTPRVSRTVDHVVGGANAVRAPLEHLMCGGA
jgi:hypothetical protein